MNGKRKKLLKEDFSAHFTSALIDKDLHYLQDLARALRQPLFTGTVVKELFGLPFKNNTESQDGAGAYRALKDL